MAGIVLIVLFSKLTKKADYYLYFHPKVTVSGFSQTFHVFNLLSHLFITHKKARLEIHSSLLSYCTIMLAPLSGAGQPTKPGDNGCIFQKDIPVLSMTSCPEIPNRGLPKFFGSALPVSRILWQAIPEKSVSSFNSLLQKCKSIVKIDKLMVEKSNRMSRKYKSYGEKVTIWRNVRLYVWSAVVCS